MNIFGEILKYFVGIVHSFCWNEYLKLAFVVVAPALEFYVVGSMG